MKKSNKITALYVISSILLFVVLTAGGIYGVYVSVGVNFARSTMSNMTGGTAGNVSSYSYGGSVNFDSSMVGVIILSIALIVIAIFDFVSLIKQVVLFKQFKLVSESKLEKKIEKKVKSKGVVIFFAVLIDILSFAVGIAGIFVNANSFIASNVSWILYLIDGLVATFSLISLVLLIVKLKKVKMVENKNDKNPKPQENDSHNFCEGWFNVNESSSFDINDMEIKLLKLKHLKTCKLLTAEEYEILRDKVLNVKKPEKDDKIEQKD